ncbi:MAG TPA: hypothetical protein VM029_14725 [Opitutaceae bacterium]|nr:hypothetical protein [Opitutaceae bacterium]
MSSVASTFLCSTLLFVASAALRAEDVVPFTASHPAFSADLPDLEAAALRPSSSTRADHLFPRQGHGMITALTGIPYVGVVEYAHGFTDRFAVGFFAGTITPEIKGYGIRPRYIVAQPARDFRVHAKAPTIYYPASPGLKSWFLAWPSVTAEWRRESGMRLWTGVGLVATNGGLTNAGAGYGATGTPAIRSYGSGYSSGTGGHGAGTYSSAGRTGVAKPASSEGGVWNTFQLGFSRPFTRGLTFQFEAAAVMKGAKLSPADRWVAGPPVILTTGLAYAF